MKRSGEADQVGGAGWWASWRGYTERHAAEPARSMLLDAIDLRASEAIGREAFEDRCSKARAASLVSEGMDAIPFPTRDSDALGYAMAKQAAAVDRENRIKAARRDPGADAGAGSAIMPPEQRGQFLARRAAYDRWYGRVADQLGALRELIPAMRVIADRDGDDEASALWGDLLEIARALVRTYRVAEQRGEIVWWPRAAGHVRSSELDELARVCGR